MNVPDIQLMRKPLTFPQGLTLAALHVTAILIERTAVAFMIVLSVFNLPVLIILKIAERISIARHVKRNQYSLTNAKKGKQYER